MATNQRLWLGKDYSNLIAKDWVQLERPFEGESVPDLDPRGQFTPPFTHFLFLDLTEIFMGIKVIRGAGVLGWTERSG